MSYFPTPYRYLVGWRVDPRDPRPSARAKAAALRKAGRR